MSSVVHSNEGEREQREIRSPSSSHLQSQNVPYIHRVGVPPKQNLFKEFGATVKETFFPDDPLRPFKDQPKSKKLLLGIQAVFPILEWGRSYNFVKFRGDLIAGFTIASLCIPQDIGYAKLANLGPQFGLYSSFVPPLIYACMGSSRDIAIGPVAVVSLLLGTLYLPLPIVDSPLLRLTSFQGLPFIVLTQCGFVHVVRLGFLIDFLSHAAVVGFMGGAAITIALQQLKGFLGIQNFTKKSGIVPVMHSVFQAAHHGTVLVTEVGHIVVVGQLILANPGPVVIDKLHLSDFANLIGEDKIFLTVADAVASCSPKLAEEEQV